MASFSQEIRTSTVVLSRPIQASCLPDCIVGSTNIKNISPSEVSPCTLLTYCRNKNVPEVSCTYSPEPCTVPIASQSCEQEKISKGSSMCIPSSLCSDDFSGHPSSISERTDVSSGNMHYHLPVVQQEKSCNESNSYHSISNSSPEGTFNNSQLTTPDRSSKFITVPFGWKRMVSNGQVTYISPSEYCLHSLQEVAVYLQTEGTCKCGLECPLLISKVFNFDPSALAKSWSVTDFSWNDPTKLCNHKRKIVAMATFQNSTNPQATITSVSNKSSQLPGEQALKKEGSIASKRKRLKGKNRSPFDGVLVSQLLAQRDRLGLRKDRDDCASSKSSSSESQHQLCSLQNMQGLTNSSAENIVNDIGRHNVILDQKKNSPQLPSLIPLEEQHIAALGKLGSGVNCGNLNQNFYLPDSFFPNKGVQSCIQSLQQPSNVNNTNVSIAFHKHLPVSLPCVVPEQIISKNPEVSNCTKSCSSVPTVTHQNFRPSLQQHVMNSNPHFLPANNVSSSVTVNCGNGSSQNLSSQMLSTPLSANQCADINNYSQVSSNLSSGLVQSSNAGTLVFRPEASNHSSGAGNVTASAISPGFGQNFAPPLQSLSKFSCPRPMQSNDDALCARPKVKKTVKTKGKMNCVLDRGSPCPNVDVRQIPPEHHRPPPEAFAAVVNHSQNGNIATVIPGQTTVLHQIPHGDSLVLPYASTQNIPGVQSLHSQSGAPNSFVPPSVTPEIPTSGTGSPLNSKASQNNSFVPFHESGVSRLFSHTNPSGPVTVGNSLMLNTDIGCNSQVSSGDCTSHSVQSTSVAAKAQYALNCGNISSILQPQCNIQIKSYEDQNTASSNLCSTLRNINNSVSPESKSADVNPPIHQFTSVNAIGSSCSLPSVIMPASNSAQTVNFQQPTQNTPNFHAISTSPVHPSAVNVPLNAVSSQSHVSVGFNSVRTSQCVTTCSPVRPNISVAQAPLVYGGVMQSSPGQKPEATSLFLPNTGTVDGVTPIRPSVVQQDASGILVHQVLSQKFSEYTPGNVLSTARAQVVQQVSGMVLPATAAPNVSPHQVVLTPTQVRMTSSGGLITMLPTGMTNNSVVGGAHVLTAPAQHLAQQMVIPDAARQNIINPHQHLLQNNCFIMNPPQPTYVARPPQTAIVSGCPVSCSASVPLSFSNANAGSSYSSPPEQNIMCSTLPAGSLIHKTQDGAELLQQRLGNSEVQTVTDNKEFNNFTNNGFHILQPPSQRLSGQKLDSCDIMQDGWSTNQELKHNSNEFINQVAKTILSNVPTSAKSVPSNISGQAVLTSCGQIFINGDGNHGVNPQSVTVSNVARMTGMIPLVGGQCALNSPMPPLSVPNVTAVTTTMTQMIPAIGIAPQILGQPVQPVVQVINTVPFNSMQNAVLVPGAPNMLSQTVRFDTLQASPVLGAPTQNVFNGVVLPPNSVSCVQATSVATVGALGSHHSGVSVANFCDESKISNDSGHETRGTPGSNSSCSTPASSCSSTPAPPNGDIQCTALRDPSPAVRKRVRDGKRKSSNQTVASMLQYGSQSSSVSLNNTSTQQQQQQSPQQHHHPQQQQNIQSQQPSLAPPQPLTQQFLQPSVLQTLTVLPSQPRPLLQQPVMNYNSIGSVGGHQILTTGLASPLGIVQPLSMLGVTPAGTTVIQNIPVQQVVPGPHFPSLTVLQGPHTVSSLPQEQSVVVNDTSNMNVHPTHLHSAFAGGSYVPNMVATNPVIGTPVGGTEVLVNTTLQSSSTVAAFSRTPSLPQHFSSVLPQHIPPVAQSLSPTTGLGNTKTCRTNVTTTSAVSTPGASFATSSGIVLTSVNTCNVLNSDVKVKLPIKVDTTELLHELNQSARSVGVQSGDLEQNASVQTIASTDVSINPVNTSVQSNLQSLSSDDSQSTKHSLQEISSEEVKPKCESKNLSSLLSSESESCESPWPDPVNLSAAVRAVVQEQADIYEDTSNNNPPNSSGNNNGSLTLRINNCSALVSEPGATEQLQNCDMVCISSTSNNSDPVDLRTASSQPSDLVRQESQSDIVTSELMSCGSGVEVSNLGEWREQVLPVITSRASDSAAENASTTSSDSSEQTSTDSHVTSDSGVESGQEPMNLACIRENDVIRGTEMIDGEQDEEEEISVFASYNDSLNLPAVNTLVARRHRVKRIKREHFLFQEEGKEESDELMDLKI